MSTSESLRSALQAVNPNLLLAEFIQHDDHLQSIADGCAKIAIWSNTLSSVEPENPARPFLAEMQRASHDVAILVATALYVPAATAMRSALETALYYSYFRSHSAELTTLATLPNFYLSKKEILDYHKIHSPFYREYARDFGYPTRLEEWYSRISAIIHGQIPGTWGRRLAIAEMAHDDSVMQDSVISFTDGVDVIHRLFLLTAGAELWGAFHHESKRALSAGIPPDLRSKLNLDGRI